MSTRPTPAAHPAAPPTTRPGWHKLLLGLFLLTRAIRIPIALDGTLGAQPSPWWNALWAVLGLVLAAFAVSEWEILRAASWQMRLPQWICMVLFHIGFTGFTVWLVLEVF
jgi:hypothetical protein